jgi:hypothetical protein
MKTTLGAVGAAEAEKKAERNRAKKAAVSL